MKTARMTAAIAIGLAACPARADVPTDAQAAVIRHTAEAIVLARRCGTMRVDEVTAAALLAAHGMPANAYSPGGPFEAAIARAIERAKDDAGDLDGAHACRAARLMFGPDGGNVPGLVEAF